MSLYIKDGELWHICVYNACDFTHNEKLGENDYVFQRYDRTKSP